MRFIPDALCHLVCGTVLRQCEDDAEGEIHLPHNIFCSHCQRLISTEEIVIRVKEVDDDSTDS